MATQTKAVSSTKTTAIAVVSKKGQKAKTAAPVLRPTVPTGWHNATNGTTATKAGTKPSVHYPQGTAQLNVLPLMATAGARVQVNHAAIIKALGGSKGCLTVALANGATRRNVRQLARAGYLTWQQPSE